MLSGLYIGKMFLPQKTTTKKTKADDSLYTNNLNFVSRLNSFPRLIERPYTPELRSPNTRRLGVTSFSLFYTNPICRLQLSQTYKHTLTYTLLTSPPSFKRALPLEPQNLNSMHSGGFLKILLYENLLGDISSVGTEYGSTKKKSQKQIFLNLLFLNFEILG